jgi:hypothetical protein
MWTVQVNLARKTWCRSVKIGRLYTILESWTFGPVRQSGFEPYTWVRGTALSFIQSQNEWYQSQCPFKTNSSASSFLGPAVQFSRDRGSNPNVNLILGVPTLKISFSATKGLGKVTWRAISLEKMTVHHTRTLDFRPGQTVRARTWNSDEGHGIVFHPILTWFSP